MNKKTIIIIISSILALALLVTGTVLLLNSKFTDTKDKTSSSQNDNNTTSDISNSEDNSNSADIKITGKNTKKGKKISLPIKISKNEGIMGIMLDLKYDTELLKYTGYKKGKLFTDSEASANDDGTIKFVAIADKDITKGGTVVTLEFEVISNKAKETTVEITNQQASNYDEKFVELDIENAVIKIK